MNYKEWKEKKQKEVNELPLHFAFGNKQFDELCERLNAKPEDFVYFKSLAGALVLEKDVPVIKEYLERKDDLQDLIKDYDFAKDAFIYEMGNHEYHINWQADWDVMNCFTAIAYKDECTDGYLKRIPWEEQTKQAYKDAAREFYRMCDENEWW